MKVKNTAEAAKERQFHTLTPGDVFIIPKSDIGLCTVLQSKYEDDSDFEEANAWIKDGPIITDRQHVGIHSVLETGAVHFINMKHIVIPIDGEFVY